MSSIDTKFKPGNKASNKYDPKYCQMAIDFGREGRTRMELAAEIGVVRDTILNWEKKHKDFACALHAMEDYAVAWYQGVGRRALLGEFKFDTGLYKFLTKTRFRNRDEFEEPAGETQDKQVNITVNSSPVKVENA